MLSEVSQFLMTDTFGKPTLFCIFCWLQEENVILYNFLPGQQNDAMLEI